MARTGVRAVAGKEGTIGFFLAVVLKMEKLLKMQLFGR